MSFRNRAGPVVLATAALVMSACSAESTAAPATDDETAATATTLTGTDEASEAGGVVPVRNDSFDVRRFDYRGSVVLVRTPLAELPEQASVIVGSGTVLDNGGGPMFCLGPIMLSHPPQCGGPFLDGLSSTEFMSTVSGTSWGLRTITTEWPTVNNRLRVIEDEPAAFNSRQDFEDPDRFRRPTECGDPAEAEGPPQELGYFAVANTARTEGTVAYDDGQNGFGIGVLAEHIETIRRELLAAGLSACVFEVDYSADQLRAAQEVIVDDNLFQEAMILSLGSGNGHNRVTVQMVVADKTAIDLVLDLAGDPGMYRFESTATILK